MDGGNTTVRAEDGVFGGPATASPTRDTRPPAPPDPPRPASSLTRRAPVPHRAGASSELRLHSCSILLSTRSHARPHPASWPHNRPPRRSRYAAAILPPTVMIMANFPNESATNRG